MKIIPRIIVAFFLIILVVGGAASMDLIPRSWFAHAPAWGQTVLVVCCIIFTGMMIFGYAFDSGIFQKIFKKKE